MNSILGNIIADFKVQLTSKISVGGTTSSINTNKDADGNTIPDGRYCISIDRTSGNKEHFTCVISGTTITALKTVNRTTGAETSGALRQHNFGAEVIISDFANMKFLQQLLEGTTVLENVLTYDTGIAPINGGDLANKSWVLSVINGGPVTFDQNIVPGMAGETFSSGSGVYLKESDGRWYMTNGTLLGTVSNVKLGIAQSGGTSGSSITSGVLIGGRDSTQTYTAGSLYYAGDTPGSVTTTPGTNVKVLGVGDANGKLIWVAYDRVSLATSLTTDSSTSSGFDQAQNASNAIIEFGQSDTTAHKNILAQSFSTTKAKMRGFRLKKKLDSGQFTGTVTIALYGDSGSTTPAGVLASVTLTSAQWNAIPDASIFDAIFSSEYDSATIGGSYWIVCTASSADDANHPNLAYQNTDVYAGGVLKYKNTTDGWVSVTGDLWFTTLEGNISQITKTDANGELSGLQKPPITRIYTTKTSLGGSSTTQFDVTNTFGNIFRYTFNGTGTNPSISSSNPVTGTAVNVQGQNFASTNKGIFIITNSGTNFFEVYNPSGVIESGKAVGTGFMYNADVWVTPYNLKYITVEVLGAGGGSGGAASGSGTFGCGSGAGAGGYARKMILRSALDPIVAVAAGLAGTGGGSNANGNSGGISGFGPVTATGGAGGLASGNGSHGGGTGGTGSGGDLNVMGGSGADGLATGDTFHVGQPLGGASFFGGQGAYGSGGQGSLAGGGGNASGNAGTNGLVIVTEYY